MAMPGKTSVFNNIKLHDCDAADVVSIIFRGYLAGRSYIVTPNIDHFFRLDLFVDERFNQAYANSDITVCDSRIVRILSRLEEDPIRKICPGSDLTERLFNSRELRSKSVLVVGSQPDLIEELGSKYGVENIECYSPSMGFIKNSVEFGKCVDFILSCKADIVFLALGSPQQEIVAYAVKSANNSEARFNGVMLCVGASLDFLTGVSARAPVLVQRLHLEWLHRALSNPSKLLPRYISNFQWIIGYVYRAFRARLSS